MPVLAGDVGATNTRLALTDGPTAAGPTRYRNGDFPSFGGVLEAFLDAHGRPAIDAAAIAVAGPVLEGQVRMTNLPWTVAADDVAALLRTPRVRLLNDLEGAAFGIPHVPDDRRVSLTPGVRGRTGSIGLVVPGTGLGEALLCWDGARFHPMASEGGHADFGPSNADDDALLAFLRAQGRTHVSWEDVCAGPALLRLYEFLRDTGRATEPADLRARLDAGDAAAVVTEQALGGGPAICVRALAWWMRLLGAEAGNLALKGLTTGGLHLGGAIVGKLAAPLVASGFLAAFRAKGPHAALMAEIPITILLEPDLPLVGARHFARRLAHGMKAA